MDLEIEIGTRFPPADYSFYEMAPEERLCRIAEGYQGAMFGPDDPRGQPADAYSWSFSENLCLADFLDSDEDWADAWRMELEIWKDEGQPDRYDDMMDGRPIQEAIIVVMHEGRPHLWDGWHRVAAMKSIRRATIPAIIGTLKAG